MPDPLPPGYMLGHYRIDAALHRGAAGRFYRAFNSNTRATVAINVLDAGAQDPKLALEILETSQDLARAGDVRLLDLGILDGGYYVAVDYVPDEKQIFDIGRVAIETLSSRKGRTLWARLWAWTTGHGTK
jgi:serine/threonine protein kinase